MSDKELVSLSCSHIVALHLHLLTFKEVSAETHHISHFSNQSRVENRTQESSGMFNDHKLILNVLVSLQNYLFPVLNLTM